MIVPASHPLPVLWPRSFLYLWPAACVQKFCFVVPRWSLHTYIWEVRAIDQQTLSCSALPHTLLRLPCSLTEMEGCGHLEGPNLHSLLI